MRADPLMASPRVRKIRLAVWAMAGLLVTGLPVARAADEIPDIKPGLLEMQIQGGMGAEMQQAMQQMQDQMAEMSPEERQQMQAMMGNMGMKMGGAGGVRICMTPEDIQQAEIPVNEGNCITKFTSRTATRWAGSAVCTDPDMTVESEAIFISPLAYSVKMKGVRMEEGREQPFEMGMAMKRISADCGDVKPRTR